MKLLPGLFSEALADAVLALSALISESGTGLGRGQTGSQGATSRPTGDLRRRRLPDPKTFTPAPDFRFDNALTRRGSQSLLSMKQKCMVRPVVKGPGAGGTTVGGGGNSTTGGVPPDSGGLQGPKGGLMQVVDEACGPSGAVSQVNVAAGPNGNINWINCGISKTNSSDDGGWNPPTVLLPDLVYLSLTTALQDPNTPFSACNAYIDQFESVAQSHELPPIMMASFAMQESGCNPNATGQGGEVGMFQLSPDKCKGGHNCFDATTNMGLAANYIQAQLKLVGGNVFMMIGNYNGWTRGMTFEAATADANTTCCHCQNNLDYVHQVVNGWYQNIDNTWYGPNGQRLGRPSSLGTFFNLNVCAANAGDGAIGRRSIPSFEIPMRRRDGRGWRF